MKKLKEAVESVKYGAVLTINKDNRNVKNNKYNSCIILYDGRILKVVKCVELGDFLSIIPNVANQLDKGYIYQVKYLHEERKYQSTIQYITENSEEELHRQKVIGIFEVQSDSFLDSIIELDTQIANLEYMSRLISKEKRIASA